MKVLGACLSALLSASCSSVQALEITDQHRILLKVDLTEGVFAPFPDTELVGDFDTDPELYPLGLCQGDCDSDEDCKGNLVCELRDEDDPVNGCTVTDDAGTSDFCVFPEIGFLAFQPDKDDLPLGICEGDCDGNAQCGEGLICWQRERGDPVPGCSGIEEYEAESNRPTDFCVSDIYKGNYTVFNMTEPTPPKLNRPIGELINMGNNGKPADRFPLQNCQSDCDTDDECAGDLVCLMTEVGDTVPGCNGTSNGLDHCYDNSTVVASEATTTGSGTGTTFEFATPQLERVGDEGIPRSAFPLDVCQGDCDNDGECQSGLTCYGARLGDSVPGCGGVSDGTDYCVLDTSETVARAAPDIFG